MGGKTPDRYGGSFRNLREGTAIREIVVTPGHSVYMLQLKLNQYMECLVALVLHEIFVRKFSENRNVLMEELGQYHDEEKGKLKQISDEMEKILERDV